MAVRKPQKWSTIAGLLATAFLILGITISHGVSISLGICSGIAAVVCLLYGK